MVLRCCVRCGVGARAIGRVGMVGSAVAIENAVELVRESTVIPGALHTSPAHRGAYRTIVRPWQRGKRAVFALLLAESLPEMTARQETNKLLRGEAAVAVHVAFTKCLDHLPSQGVVTRRWGTGGEVEPLEKGHHLVPADVSVAVGVTFDECFFNHSHRRSAKALSQPAQINPLRLTPHCFTARVRAPLERREHPRGAAWIWRDRYRCGVPCIHAFHRLRCRPRDGRESGGTWDLGVGVGFGDGERMRHCLWCAVGPDRSAITHRCALTRQPPPLRAVRVVHGSGHGSKLLHGHSVEAEPRPIRSQLAKVD
eukprot:Hpha_TRINITY_DN16903_c2_g6::TRINITY_DN16903_c2_g6_i1::g.53516::m.53516